jgi:hypothetical protein
LPYSATEDLKAKIGEDRGGKERVLVDHFD